LFNLEGLTQDRSIRVITSRQFRHECVDAQRDVYDSHRHRVFAVAFYMTGNEIEAEQILTSTFVEAFREAVEPQGDQVDLALVAELRKRFPLDQSEPYPDIQTGASAGALGERNVRRTELEEAIQTLPPNERLLFLLRDVEGYSPAAIADLLQMAEANVQRGLFSARIRLRRALAGAENPKVRELPGLPLQTAQDEAKQDAA
jgi:RNA polymerase sigma-70 factor (ECF subfamily)